MEEKKIPQIERKESREERVVRLLSTDIEGKMKVYVGLTKIKGISWALSNTICEKLKIDKQRKLGSLSNEEITEITEFMKHPNLPPHLVNRRNDFDEGTDSHLIGSDLELKKEFDIKRLKKIKSYRGIRHVAKLPSRGQRTKGHFRSNRKKSGGIKKKKTVE